MGDSQSLCYLDGICPLKKTRSEVGEHPSFGESSYAIDPLLVVP